ncbi:hypothetical protein CK203_073229 [Vitis vinifera]|uniref:BED-type domain-containing protein n=1 Tax=Vitis vinifera TaxID=29760 RepID=A0A438ENL5_VITVI|nr:hypothetical protein CK203_073229 [Vitis vinifera]
MALAPQPIASSLEPLPITSQKHDPAWKHCQMFKNGDRVQLKCLYCGKVFKGGGIHRIKEHLAGQKGNASTCLRVSPDVRLLMQQSLDGVVVKKKKKQKIAEEITSISPLPTTVPETLEPDSSLLVTREEGKTNRGTDRRKRGRVKRADKSAIPDAVAINSIALDSKRGNNQVHMAIARFLYDAGVPLEAVNSVYFQQMINAIASGGPGVAAPSYQDLRGWILKNSVEEVKNDIDQYMGTWARTGCSVLVDQWNTHNGRILINILAHCPEGIMFLRSVDVSDIMNSADALYELLKEVVEEVGVRNVLQVITNGEEQYLVAGKRLSDTFPTLYWAPCASRCLDLMLEDFGKLEWINATLEQAKSIASTRNDSFCYKLYDTERMVDLKQNLQDMITSQEWMDCPCSKKPGGLEMLDLIRIYRAKETIKKQLVKKEDYIVYWNIIDNRWEQQWHVPLHAAGFYLNPKFFYSIEGDIHNEIVSGMLDCIERLVPDTIIQDKIMKELNTYKNSIGDFGRKMAIRARDTLLPAEWWSTYGGSCPNLARLAIRVLSQPCSSIVNKRNQISFEQMHDSRNCLEHQRLIDLVFVQYNLRLMQIVQMNREHDPRDPISFDSSNVVDDWVSGKEACLQDYGTSDWMALDPPSGNTMLLGPSNDEAEDLGAGFDDDEIFNRVKDVEEDNIEDNVVSQ